MNRKKIIVRAYVNENFGDDLFLKILFERYKNVDFYLLDVNERECKAFKAYTNVNYITMKEFVKTHYLFQGFVDIGGSIFIQEGKGLGGFKKRLLVSLLLKYRKKKTYILGANFGPYNTAYFKTIYKYYFKFFVEDVCFRDQSSYTLFKELKNVRYGPDIVFQLGANERNIQKKPNTLGISVMDLKRLPKLKMYTDQYNNQMVSLINKSYEKGFNISLISFCNNQGDKEAIHNIISMLNNDVKNNINILEYKSNIEAFVNEYKSLENVVSLRFHSFILSLIYNQNIFPLIYSQKTLNVISDLDSAISYSEMKDLKNLNMESLLLQLQKNNFDISHLLSQAKSQFKILDFSIKDK